MTHKVITFEFAAPTVLAAALGTVLSIGAIYLTNRYFGPVDQSEANHSVSGGSEWLSCQNLMGGFRAFTCCSLV